MKKVSSSDLRAHLEKEFFKKTPQEQAAIIRALPNINDRKSVVEKVLFGHKAFATIGLLNPKLVAQTIKGIHDHERPKIFTELIKQPYFEKVWDAIVREVTPDKSFNGIPIDFLVSAFQKEAAELSNGWAQVEKILAAYDDDGVLSVRYNLGGEDPRATPVYKFYKKTLHARDGNIETWVRNLFEVVSIETKAELFASLSDKLSIRKVFGLLATYYSGADIDNYFMVVSLGDYDNRKSDHKSLNLSLFANTYAAMIRKYQTPASSVGAFLGVFHGGNTFRDIGNEIPLPVLQKVVSLYPKFRKDLSPEIQKLLKGDIGIADMKQMIGQPTVVDIVAKKIKQLPAEKKLLILVQ